MDFHPTKNGINRYWSIPIWNKLFITVPFRCEGSWMTLITHYFTIPDGAMPAGHSSRHSMASATAGSLNTKSHGDSNNVSVDSWQKATVNSGYIGYEIFFDISTEKSEITRKTKPTRFPNHLKFWPDKSGIPRHWYLSSNSASMWPNAASASDSNSCGAVQSVRFSPRSPRLMLSFHV